MRRWSRSSRATSSCLAKTSCTPAIASSTGRTRVDSSSRLLILGLGNLLCGDDGLGALAAQRIAETRVLPDGVKVLDGGTLGLSLLPYLEDAESAILVDAIAADGP